MKRTRFSFPVIARFAALLLCLNGVTAYAVDEIAPHKQPVKAIADQRLEITTAAGAGTLSLYVSRDWMTPQPAVTRAVLVFHGRLRDADVHWRSSQNALASACGLAALFDRPGCF